VGPTARGQSRRPLSCGDEGREASETAGMYEGDGRGCAGKAFSPALLPITTDRADDPVQGLSTAKRGAASRSPATRSTMGVRGVAGSSAASRWRTLDGLEEAGAHVDRATPAKMQQVPHGRPEKLAGLHQLAGTPDNDIAARRAADRLGRRHPSRTHRGQGSGLWKNIRGATPLTPRRHAPGIEEDVGTELLLGDLAPPREGLDLHGAPQAAPLLFFFHPTG